MIRLQIINQYVDSLLTTVFFVRKFNASELNFEDLQTDLHNSYEWCNSWLVTLTLSKVLHVHLIINFVIVVTYIESRLPVSFESAVVLTFTPVTSMLLCEGIISTIGYLSHTIKNPSSTCTYIFSCNFSIAIKYICPSCSSSPTMYM